MLSWYNSLSNGERTACMAIVDDDHFLHYYISLYNEEATALASSSHPISSSSSSSSSLEYNNNDNIIIINNSDDSNSNNNKSVYHAKFSREYLVCQYQSLSQSKRHHHHFHHHHHINLQELKNTSNNNDNSNEKKNNKNSHNNDNSNDEETTTSCTRSSISSSSSQPFSTTSSESDSDTNSDGQWDTQVKDKTDSDTTSCDDDNENIKVAPKMIYKAGDAHEQDMYRLFNDFQDKHVTVSFVTNPAVLDSLFINVSGYDNPTKLIDTFKKLTRNKIFSHELSYEEAKELMTSDFPELPWMKDLYPVSLYEVLLARIELSMWTSYYRILEHHKFKLPQRPLGKSNGMLSINKAKKDEENQDDSVWMITSKSPLVILPSWSVMFATACSIEEMREAWEKLTPNIQNDILSHCPFVKIFYRDALRNKAPLSFLDRLVLCPLRYVCHDRAMAIKNEYDYIGNYKSESTIPPPDIVYNNVDDIKPKDDTIIDGQSVAASPSFKVTCIPKPPEVHPSLSGLRRVNKTPAEKEKNEAARIEALRVEAERIEAEKIEDARREAEKAVNERLEADRIEALRIETERAAEAERKACEERRKKKIKEKKKKQIEKKRKMLLAAESTEYKESSGHIDSNDACLIDTSNNGLASNTIVINDRLSNDMNEGTKCVDSTDDHMSSDNEDHDMTCTGTYNDIEDINENTTSNNDSIPLNHPKITYSIGELYSLRDNISENSLDTSRISNDDKNNVIDDVSDADSSFNSDYHDSNQNYQQLPNFHTTFYRNNNYDFKSLEKRLTRNIRNYNFVMNNRMEAHKLTRIAVTLELRSIVSSLWPHAMVCVYGSCITGLALPSSDIDFVVKLTQHSGDFYNQQKYVPAYYHLNQSSTTNSSTTSSPLCVPPIETMTTTPDTYLEPNNTFCQSIVGDIAERAYLEANPILLPGASLPKLPPRYLGHTVGHCPNQQEVLNALFALTAQLNMQHWTASVNPIPTAAVPVVKMQALPEHLLCLPHVQASVSSLYYEETMYQKGEPPLIPFHLMHGISIPVDISIEAGEHKGISSCEFIQHALSMRSPVLASVVKVVKGLLQQAGYNMPFNGGLSSYSIFIMVCAIYDLEMICEIKRLAAKDTHNPNYVTDAHIAQAAKNLTEGTLFLNFLRFFSHQFDPSVTGIDITNPSIIFQLSSEQHALIGTSVWLSNPFDQSNIARPSFAFKQIQYLFGLMLHTFESNFRHIQLHHQLQQHSTSNSKSNNEYADENIDFIRMYISF